MTPARLHPLPADPPPLVEADVLVRIYDAQAQNERRGQAWTALVLRDAAVAIERLRERLATLERGT